MRGNLRGGERKAEKVHGRCCPGRRVDVKASAEREAQAASEACGCGEESAAAAVVKLIGNQLG